MEVAAERQKNSHAGRVPTTQDVEPEIVDYINDRRKQNMAVTRAVVMRKLIALKPDGFGGIPLNTGDPRATDKLHNKFAHWYQRFRQGEQVIEPTQDQRVEEEVHRVGRVGMGDDPEGSRRVHRNREEAHHGPERRGGERICGR